MKNNNNSTDAFTSEELHHIDTLQSQADAEVSNPNSSFYEPDPSNRFTAARKLMQQWEEERAEAHRAETHRADAEVIEAELTTAASYFSTHPVLDMSPGDLKERRTEINEYLSRWPKSEQDLWIEYYEDEL